MMLPRSDIESAKLGQGFTLNMQNRDKSGSEPTTTRYILYFIRGKHFLGVIISGSVNFEEVVTDGGVLHQVSYFPISSLRKCD